MLVPKNKKSSSLRSMRSRREVPHKNPGQEDWHLGEDNTGASRLNDRDGLVFYIFEVQREPDNGRVYRNNYGHNNNHNRGGFHPPGSNSDLSDHDIEMEMGGTPTVD